VIQFQFFAEVENWIGNLCSSHAATIKVMSLRPVGPEKDGYVTHFVEIFSERTTAEDLTEGVREFSTVIECDLAKISANRLIGAVTSKGCGVCSALVESSSNCFIAPAQTVDDCKMSYKLFISGEGLPNLLHKLHERGIAYTIADVSPLSTRKKMTSRQERVLKTALELGFYEYPKRITTEHLANILKIRSGTLSEILRRAEKYVVSSYFTGEAG
jgi:predicted DNA binding protein